MNANYGILYPLGDAPRDKALKKRLLAERSLAKTAQIRQYLSQALGI